MQKVVLCLCGDNTTILLDYILHNNNKYIYDHLFKILLCTLANKPIELFKICHSIILQYLHKIPMI